MTRNRFQKGSGCYKCRSCGKLTRSTGRGDNELVEMCADCYDEAGVENEHLDGGHVAGSLPNECPMCVQALRCPHATIILVGSDETGLRRALCGDCKMPMTRRQVGDRYEYQPQTQERS